MSNYTKNLLLPRLNAIVQNYEKASNVMIFRQQIYFFVLLLTFAIALIAGLLLLFRPLQRLYENTSSGFKQVLEALDLERIRANQSSKMAALGEMSAGIAHEINNPLTVIQGITRILLRQAKNNSINGESAESMLAKIELMTLRISKIIKSLSSISRNSANDPMLDVSVNALITDTIELCKDRFINHEILFEFKLEKDFIILCREVEISQVIINLLNNSAEFPQSVPLEFPPNCTGLISCKVYQGDFLQSVPLS